MKDGIPGFLLATCIISIGAIVLYFFGYYMLKLLGVEEPHHSNLSALIGIAGALGAKVFLSPSDE